MSAERVELTEVEREALADEVYEFLVSDGYHAHYPSAEAQAVKCVLGGLSPAVERIVAARVQQARAEALAPVLALADEWEATPEHIKCYGLDRAHGSRLRAAVTETQAAPTPAPSLDDPALREAVEAASLEGLHLTPWGPRYLPSDATEAIIAAIRAHLASPAQTNAEGADRG